MDLHFLGTGSCYPSPSRGASCTVLRHETGCWMFDCGEGSQIQLMKSTIRPGRITKIFITHLHGDHLFGLPGLLCTMGMNCSDGRQPIDIYGPVGLRKFIRVSLQLSRSLLGYPYVVHELEYSGTCFESAVSDWESNNSDSVVHLHPDETPGRTICKGPGGVWDVCREGRLCISAAPLTHRVLCFGYVIQEDPLPGKLDPGLLKQKGIPPGPLYAKIKSGQSIIAPDGSSISSADVVGPVRPGRKLVVLGDTCDSTHIAEIASNADILVHEATHENEMKEKALEHGHSTPGMAACFARSINAKKLVLTHFSQRYRGMNDQTSDASVTDSSSVEKLVKQAKEEFSGDVLAAEDLSIVTIPLRQT